MGEDTNIFKTTRGHAATASPLMPRTRVMLVDDSLTVRSVMSRLIDGEIDLEVVAKSSSAELALAELKHIPVDVVLLDLEMPGMGGLDALPKILGTYNDIQVLVVSSLTEDGAEATLQALSMGAADTMLKPRSGGFNAQYCETLFAKIRALGPNDFGARCPEKINPGPTPTVPKSLARPELIAIGASTGGIHAMCQLLRSLSPAIDTPILVTQHLPGSFMQVFANQLAGAAGRDAIVAQNGTPIKAGKIYIAPGCGHLNVRKTALGLVAKITREPVSSGCMPSVDPMLASASKATEGRAISIILSGMGKDGVDGASALAAAGGTIMVQDQVSSAVWGMPRAAVERGLASAILKPTDLGKKISSLFGTSSWK